MGGMTKGVRDVTEQTGIYSWHGPSSSCSAPGGMDLGEISCLSLGPVLLEIGLHNLVNVF